MLFTLDDAIESMEGESLDIGITSVLEALDHTTGALRNTIVPSDQVLFGPASCPFLPLHTFCILNIVSQQCLIGHNRGKSRFLHQQKEALDHLIKEAWLCGEVIAQLVAAQQRVVERTPLAEEVANLRLWVADAHRDADEAEVVEG